MRLRVPSFGSRPRILTRVCLPILALAWVPTGPGVTLADGTLLNRSEVVRDPLVMKSCMPRLVTGTPTAAVPRQDRLGLGPVLFSYPCGNVITGVLRRSPGASLIGKLLAERARNEPADDSFPGLRIEGVCQSFAGDAGKHIFALQPAGFGV